MQKVKVLRMNVKEGKVDRVEDLVAKESALHIFVNRLFYATIICSPSDLKELAIGHLLTEGIIRNLKEIEEVRIKGQTCKVAIKLDVDFRKRIRFSRNSLRMILSECGGEKSRKLTRRLPNISSDLSVHGKIIMYCASQLNLLAETYRKTGGVHAAAIWTSEGSLIAAAEDVGRHNAVDKAIGLVVTRKRDLSRCFLTLTGRLSQDIVLKSAIANVPIVSSLAAATDSGIALAQKINLSLVGFVRGNRMNIYSRPERIVS